MSTSQKNPKKTGNQNENNVTRYEGQILDKSPIGVLITRISDGTILYANKAIAALLGIADVTSILGMPVPNFYWDAEDRKAILARFRAEGSIINRDLRARRADDSMIWVAISIQPFDFEGEQVLLSEILDISERKRIEEALVREQSFMRVLMDSAPDPIYFKDLQSRFLRSSKTLSEMFGVSDPSDVVGKSDFDFFTKEHAQLAYEDEQTIIRTGQPIAKEERETWPDRPDTWVLTSKFPMYDETGSLVGTFGVSRDITEHKKAEAQLSESEARYHLLSASTIEGIVIHDKGILLDANQTFAAIFGYEQKEVIGMSAMDFLTPETREITAQNIRSGYEKPYDVMGVRKDGTTFPVEITGKAIPYQERTVRIAALRDITERKEAVRIVQENEQRFRALFESANDAIFTLREDILIDCNSQTLKIFKLDSKDKIIGHSITEFSPEFQPDGVSSVQKAGEKINLALRGEATFFEWKHIHGDGTPFDADVSLNRLEIGGEILVQAIIRDMTERRQAEAELRQNELLLSNAIHIARMGYWDFDIDTQMFIFNEHYYKTFHATTAEEMGGNQMSVMDFIQRFIPPGEGAIIGSSIQEAIETKDPNFQVKLEAQNLTAQGELRWVSVWITVEKDEQGRTIKLHGVNQDITERKQAEAELRQSEILLSNAIRISRMGYWDFDIDTQMFIFNDQYYKTFHATTTEEMGGNQMSVMDFIQRFIPPGEGAIIGSSMQEAIETKDPNFQIKLEAQNFTAQGELRWASVWITVEKDEQGRTIKLHGVNQDITERKRLEAQVQQVFERRGYQVQVSTEISQEIASASKVSDLFGRVVTLTKERLGYYHTQLLRYDPAQDAVVLINGYGETGQKMFAGGHKMPLGAGLIGAAAATGETVLRSSLADDPDWQPNPMLPETKGEIAIPIKFGKQILGVLDVQSDQAGALTEDDRLLLEGLCGQIAIAMQSAELVKTIRENEARLAEALKAARLANWEYDVEKDIFTFNDAFYSIFHTTAEKAGGYQLSSARYAELFVHPDDMEVVGTEIGKALSSTERVYNTSLDHRIRYEDGGIGYITVQLTVERDENGKITRYYGANQDITERHKAQEEMAERLEEINRLYRAMSHESWKDYRNTADLPAGFMFDQAGIKLVDETVLADELFANVPMRVPGGEVVGTLTVANDPQHPTSPEDHAFLQQVSDQIALALESARLTAQTQSALTQSEKLFEASRTLTQATNLQELTSSTVKLLSIQEINRAILTIFNYDDEDNIKGLDIVANWWNGTGLEATLVGTHYPIEVIRAMSFFISPTPVFFNDTLIDERVDATTMKLVQSLNLRAVAVLPLHTGTHQIGALILEAENPHNFTQEEIRLFSALAPQVTTVVENRLQYERSQQQVERESTLNLISQKIQSATTVEAVLQIAARELGHALGAPMTIAQLSMKDRK